MPTARPYAPLATTLAVLAGLVSLTSSGLAQKSVFVRSKPHANVGTVQTAGRTGFTVPTSPMPEVRNPLPPIGRPAWPQSGPSRR
jgi:hypothetical protein